MLRRHADEGALVLEHPALEAAAQDVLDLPHRALAFLFVVRHLHQDVLLRNLPENKKKKRQEKKNERKRNERNKLKKNGEKRSTASFTLHSSKEYDQI